MHLGVYKISDRDFLRSYDPRILDEYETGQRYDCDVLVWNNKFDFHSGMLKSFPKLKVFINWGTDDANLTDEDILRERVAIKKVDYYAQQSIGEYVLMLMVAFEHSLNKDFHSDQHNHTKQLSGKKVGVVGLGKIGFRTADLLRRSLHCSVLYNAPKDYGLPGLRFASQQELFELCDYVIVAVKSRDCHIDPEVLGHANRNLVIVNISRDSVLPFTFIAPYVRGGKIRGFIGDVTTHGTEDHADRRIMLVPKTGYRAKESIDIKQNIVLFYLKQYLLREVGRKSFVHIARHGETEWNAAGIYQGTCDSSLTSKGKEPVERVGAYLYDKGIEHIFASPLGRAQETAQIIARKLMVPMTTVPVFREMDFGVFQTKPQAEVQELFKDFFTSRKNEHYKLYVPYPSGESYYEVYVRIVAAVLQMLVTHDNVLVVGHESVNRMIRGIIRDEKLTTMIGTRQRNAEIASLELSENVEQLSTI